MDLKFGVNKGAPLKLEASLVTPSQNHDEVVTPDGRQRTDKQATPRRERRAPWIWGGKSVGGQGENISLVEDFLGRKI